MTIGVFLTGLLLLVGYVNGKIHSAHGQGSTYKLFTVSAGQTTQAIARNLAEAQIISCSRLFTAYARLKGADAKIQAGTYRLSDAMSPADILSRLVSGAVYEVLFVVPEGYSMYQIAELLERQGLFNRTTFLKYCLDKNLLADLQIPAQSVEGFLFPSTYSISPGMDESGLIRAMVAKFRSVYEHAFANQSSGLSQIQILTLASMIEKEAVLPVERPLIASVFFNRLQRGMPLQSDPTAVYGVRAYAGKVSRQDILRDTPYNTYRIAGLPPGPIGNPGEDALRAVFNPAKTRYTYFVAKQDGSHAFSITLEEHNAAVTRYLKNGDARNPATP